MVSLPTSMMPGSRDNHHGLNLNWRTLQKPDSKELNKANKPNPNGKPTPRPLKNKLMPSFWKTSRRLNTWEDIWEPDLLFTTTADPTKCNSDDVLKLFKPLFLSISYFPIILILELKLIINFAINSDGRNNLKTVIFLQRRRIINSIQHLPSTKEEIFNKIIKMANLKFSWFCLVSVGLECRI